MLRVMSQAYAQTKKSGQALGFGGSGEPEWGRNIVPVTQRTKS